MATSDQIVPHSYIADLLNEIAEYLEPEMDADGGPDGYKPNRAMQLHTAVEQQLQRIQVYQQKNPLGGPAKVFRAMAECIEAGDDYHVILKEYGFQLRHDGPNDAVDAARYRFIRANHDNDVLLSQDAPAGYNGSPYMRLDLAWKVEEKWRGYTPEDLDRAVDEAMRCNATDCEGGK